MAIGRASLAWNNLQENIGKLFSAVVEIKLGGDPEE
jgi:hypothetical protein